MKRLRLLFYVLVALLWLPLLGFVVYALRNVEQEEDGRYQAVAERLFDEMERELTQLLAREERRPPTEYQLDEGQAPVSDLPFVLGYFERREGEALRHGPLRERGPELAQALETIPQLLAAATPSLAREQAPGSTQELAQKNLRSKTYDALSSLNRGAWMRSQNDDRRGREAPSLSPAGTSVVPQSLQSAATSPLSAISGGDRYLILLRQAKRGDVTATQGLVLDLPQLLDWLATRVIPVGALSRASELKLLGRAERLSPSAPVAGERRYQHRFGEPFSSMSARLTLRRLVDLEAGRYIYALSGLLLVLGAGGLFAGYRMVAAIVGYAERRSNFVSAVTHELKTPLTSIRMYGEMLRDDVVPEPEKRQRYYRIITAESERLTRLIDNVLELAKLERGQRPVSLSLGQVSGVVRETLELLEPHASELGFELIFTEEPSLPAVSFDRDALLQVLFNLVDNALKYSSDAAERRITIHCQRAGAGVCIRVADRGPGVDPSHLRLIWQPFFRGERELTRKHKGTGIGLSLVRGLVQRMGGSVSGRNTDPGFEVCVSLV